MLDMNAIQQAMFQPEQPDPGVAGLKKLAMIALLSKIGNGMNAGQEVQNLLNPSNNNPLSVTSGMKPGSVFADAISRGVI